MILHVKPFRVEREDPTGHGSDTESVSGNEDECTSIPGASPSTETSRDPGMSRDSSTSRSPPPHIPSTNLEGRIDLGEIVQAANSSWESLNSMVTKLPDDKRKQYLSFHSKSLPPPTLFTLIWLLRPVRPGMHVSKCDGWNGSLGCHTVPYLQEVFAGIVFSFQNGQIEGSH